MSIITTLILLAVAITALCYYTAKLYFDNKELQIKVKILKEFSDSANSQIAKLKKENISLKKRAARKTTAKKPAAKKPAAKRTTKKKPVTKTK